MEKTDLKLTLSRSSVPVDIPMHAGWHDGKELLYMVLDCNNEEVAKKISDAQNWRVEVAPPLSKTPEAALDAVYIFENGQGGKGLRGFQEEVFASTPAVADKYSAIRTEIKVSWKDGTTSEILSSEQQIMDAQKAGNLTLEETDIRLNMPQLVWNGGQMPLRQSKELEAHTPYGEAQILEFNKEKMMVTFVAHRGWGPDGRTIYYLVTDATPSDPAKMMGTAYAPSLAATFRTESAVDLFQFTNGFVGSGPMGFQPGIAASAIGDTNYTPLWRIFMVMWQDQEKAEVLETISDLDAFKKSGAIKVMPARPQDSDHIVNCPFVDPFQDQ